MRWLFLLLVVLNLLYFVYEKQREPWRTQATMTAGPVLQSASGLRLLSESVDSLPRNEEVDSTQAEVCLFLGGFDDETTAAALQQRLLSLDIPAAVQSVDATAGVDYWVYLPPLVSRQASLRQLRELQSRNIDSYIITVGDLSNGISLGIFSRRDSAESVVERLKRLDYSASIRELPRVHRKHWVRVQGVFGSGVPEGLLMDLIRDFSSLQHRQMPCSGIATSEQLE